jgi:hypothetical protein
MQSSWAVHLQERVGAEQSIWIVAMWLKFPVPLFDALPLRWTIAPVSVQSIASCCGGG